MSPSLYEVDKAPARLRALIYDRVSFDRTGLARSVASQDVENRAFCDRQGWEIVGTIEDNDLSASPWARKERPGYAEARRRMAAGDVDVLVCWEASRAQRDLEVYVELRSLCQRHNVLWAYSGRVYDLSRTDDRFTTGLDALLAEREVGQTRDRILRDIRTHAARGGVHGTTPFGYRRTYDQHTGALLDQVPDEDTAPIVREIVARIVRGDTLYGVVQDLNRRGVVTPQQYKDQLRGVPVQREGWTSSKIRRLLASSSVIGVRTHRGAAHPEPTWEPLVSKHDYELANMILADPTRAVHHRGVAVKHLLSGIAECAVCGGWLRGESNRGRLVYQCRGRDNELGKGHVSRPREPLEAMVVYAVVRRLSDPTFLARLVDAQKDDTAAVAARELSALRARLADSERAVADGEMTASAFGRIEARLLGQISDAEARAVPRTLPPAVRDLARPDAAQRWDSLPLPEQRNVVRALVRIRVHRTTRPRGTRGFDASSVELVWR